MAPVNYTKTATKKASEQTRNTGVYLAAVKGVEHAKKIEQVKGASKGKNAGVATSCREEAMRMEVDIKEAEEWVGRMRDESPEERSAREKREREGQMVVDVATEQTPAQMPSGAALYNTPRSEWNRPRAGAMSEHYSAPWDAQGAAWRPADWRPSGWGW